MSALVVGYGSIGARHARLLTESGRDVVCVTGNKDCPFPRYASVAEALSRAKPDVVIVANPTAQHVETLQALSSAGYQGRLLVEKPLAGTKTALPVNLPARSHVAFNLRFHPIVSALRQAIAGHRLITANFYVGMYLPDWRPGTDYRRSYSAHRAEGGGVLRDLTHELDLALWLTGDWQRVAALGGHLSDLEIDSDDVFSMLLATAHCPAVAIQLSYLDRMPRRTIVINAVGLTAVADLIAGQLTVNGVAQDAVTHRDDTYKAQLAAILGNQDGVLCTLDEGAAVDALVDAAQAAAHRRTWIER